MKALLFSCLLAPVALFASPASAQEAPANAPPAPDLVAQSTPAPAPKAKGEAPRPFITGEIPLIKSFALGADQLVPVGVLGDQQILIDGTINFRLGRNTRFYYQRTNHFDVGGRTFSGKTPKFGGASWDLEQQEGLKFELVRDLQFTEAYRYRYRICCPNAGDPKNSTPRFYGGWMSAFDWRFGPRSKIGRLFLIHLEGTDDLHTLDTFVAVPKGVKPTGALWIYKAAIEADPEFYGTPKVQPYIRLEHYDDYFANSIFPSWTNRSYYGLRLTGTDLIGYRFYVKNEHQTNPAGDVPHKVELYVEAILKFRS